MLLVIFSRKIGERLSNLERDVVDIRAAAVRAGKSSTGPLLRVNACNCNGLKKLAALVEYRTGSTPNRNIRPIRNAVTPCAINTQTGSNRHKLDASLEIRYSRLV
jgi:hypothetical protein